MESKQTQGPTCQSCSMPMEKSEDFGTNADKSKNNSYCCFCYQGGKFTAPDITMEQMIDKVAGFMVKQMSMSETQAKQIVKAFIPYLKRWR